MSSVMMVIPCFNEAARLQVDRFKQFTCARHGIRFCFVNDGSTDDTALLLEELHAIDPERFVPLHLLRNLGKAEAVRRGVLYAFEKSSDYIGYWDADLATPLAAIPAFGDLLDARPDLLFIFGARVRLLGRQIERSALRHYLGRMFATAASQVLGLAIYDTQCGAKLFRASPEVHSLFHEPFMTRWLFDIEIITRLVKSSQRLHLPPPEDLIYEFPLEEWRDIAGSKVKPRDFVTAFCGLAKIYWKYLPPSIPR